MKIRDLLEGVVGMIRTLPLVLALALCLPGPVFGAQAEPPSPPNSTICCCLLFPTDTFLTDRGALCENPVAQRGFQ